MSVDELRSRLHQERGALPHCVYRAYDDGGELLYVGCTYDFEKRHDQHARKSAWSARADRWSVRWHGNRAEALAAERLAIATEHPQANVSYEERSRRSAETDHRLRTAEQDRRRADLIKIMATLRPSSDERRTV